ncbi:MAG: biotin--[acetyl-CoA-carboxylase] ligase [Kiloniellales bacterium]|nr:biotin--[acetyl-CoA-carboxylase] ligase [Kiloniellales bacterium]
MSDPSRAVDPPRLPPAYRLVALDAVGSSNDEARRLAEAGAEDGTLVWAREQSGGRGRRGRHWASPRGNLYLSLVLRPQCSLAEAAQLGFVAALGLGDAIGSVAPPMIEVTYKWPNDVLVNGRKAAGILLESQGAGSDTCDWLVLGLGVNVASYPEETEYPATSLRFEGCPPEVTETALLEAFGKHFLTWVNRWLEEGFAPIRKGWRNHAHGLGEEIRVRLANEEVSGLFRDLDETGALVLAQADAGERRITAGEVYFP